MPAPESNILGDMAGTADDIVHICAPATRGALQLHTRQTTRVESLTRPHEIYPRSTLCVNVRSGCRIWQL
jgi:hypothetical protein